MRLNVSTKVVQDHAAVPSVMCNWIMRILGVILLALLSPAISAQKTPDCWEANRAVHDSEESLDEHFKELVSLDRYLSVSKNQLPGAKLNNVSPNRGYSFDYANDRPNASITIDSEKSYLTTINLENVFGLSDVKWVNENLIFFRVWLGREVFIDVIFHAEHETITWHQSGRRSNHVMSQWESGCKQYGGCECIQQE